MNSLEFSGMRFVPALRRYLVTNNLSDPRINDEAYLETFARKYYYDNSICGVNQLFRSISAAWVLAVSIVVLNGEIHRYMAKQTTTFQMFLSNFRGLNEGFDYPQQFLFEIYSDIWLHPLVLPS